MQRRGLRAGAGTGTAGTAGRATASQEHAHARLGLKAVVSDRRVKRLQTSAPPQKQGRRLCAVPLSMPKRAQHTGATQPKGSG